MSKDNCPTAKAQANPFPPGSAVVSVVLDPSGGIGLQFSQGLSPIAALGLLQLGIGAIQLQNLGAGERPEQRIVAAPASALQQLDGK